MQGVPFLSETRHEKFMKIKQSTDTHLIIDMENKSLDIPYADSFIVHERWQAYSCPD